MGFFDEIKNRKNPVIPENGLYITANGKEFKGGEHFPTPQMGDIYKVGSYIYQIEQLGTSDKLKASVSLNLQVTDRNKKTYEEILPEINGIKLKSADGLFKDCSKMEKAPEIPEDVSYTETFSGCYKLTEMPVFGEYRNGKAFNPFVSDAIQPNGIVLPQAIRHWSMSNDVIRAFGEKQEEPPRPAMRPRHRAAYDRKQHQAEIDYYTNHPEEINPKNQYYKLAKYPVLFETFGEKQLGPYRGEPYLSATTGTIIMNAEDKANNEMYNFDDLDTPTKGAKVRSERFMSLNLEPKIDAMIIPELEKILTSAGQETKKHSLNTENITKILFDNENIKNQYTDTQITDIIIASRYHDIGKANINKDILYAQRRLTSEEFDVIKTHPLEGQKLLEKNIYSINNDLFNDNKEQRLEIMKNIITLHHKKICGDGYPDIDVKIPQYVELVGVADVMEALTAKRSYKEPMPVQDAYQMIVDGKCGAFSQFSLDVLREQLPEIENHINQRREQEKPSIKKFVESKKEIIEKEDVQKNEDELEL